MQSAIVSPSGFSPLVSDEPHERLFRRGPNTVGDDELLALVLGTGSRKKAPLGVAREVFRAAGGIATLSRSTARELAVVRGVGAARAARIAAAFELGRRALDAIEQRDCIAGPEDIYRVVVPRIANVPQEVFFVVGIDIRNSLLDVVEVARGSVANVEVHPREVFRPLVRMAASAGVVVHNHPSGDATPSPEDIALTRRLRAVGELMSIPIVDHVVIGQGTFRSIAEHLGTEL